MSTAGENPSDPLEKNYWNMIWELIGAGVPRGLQNRCEGLEASSVGSIPTCSRQLKSPHL